MAYLLTNGTKTNNINSYIKDVLALNFNTLPTEIPFNLSGMGIKRVILKDSILSFEDRLREVVHKLLTRLSSVHGVYLSLTNLELTTTEAKLTVNIGNSGSGTYSIKILN